MRCAWATRSVKMKASARQGISNTSKAAGNKSPLIVSSFLSSRGTRHASFLESGIGSFGQPHIQIGLQDGEAFVRIPAMARESHQVLDGMTHATAMELLHEPFDGPFPGVGRSKPVCILVGNRSQDPPQAAIGPIED